MLNTKEDNLKNVGKQTIAAFIVFLFFFHHSMEELSFFVHCSLIKSTVSVELILIFLT